MGGGELTSCLLADFLSKKFAVCYIVFDKPNITDAERIFNVDLSNVQFKIYKQSFFVRMLLFIFKKFKLLNRLIEYFAFYCNFKNQNITVFINNHYSSSMPSIASHGIYMCMFPQKINCLKKNFHTKNVGSTLEHIALVVMKKLLISSEDFLKTYRTVLANSYYTQEWISRYWNRESRVLYPPCNINTQPITCFKKKNYILNVGRFSKTGHNKKREILIAAFKTFYNRGFIDWELHVCGTVQEGDVCYLNELQENVENYPIFFHINSNYDELKKLYQDSRIYWHATGYGHNPDEEPELFEHFGIVTVEAMSYGCIPVVYDGGGQREVVSPDTGYRWRTPDELLRHTEKVIKGNELSDVLAERAHQSAQRFGREIFCSEIERIINQF